MFPTLEELVSKHFRAEGYFFNIFVSKYIGAGVFEDISLRAMAQRDWQTHGGHPPYPYN